MKWPTSSEAGHFQFDGIHSATRRDYNAGMAYTLQQLEILEQAIAEGALRVRYDGKEVQYRNLSEMLSIRDLMRRELLGEGRTSRRKYLSYRPDLNG